MRRTWLRGHANILKRYLVHVAAFNLGVVMRKMLGAGTPRGLAALLAALLRLFALLMIIRKRVDDFLEPVAILRARCRGHALRHWRQVDLAPSSTGC